MGPGSWIQAWAGRLSPPCRWIDPPGERLDSPGIATQSWAVAASLGLEALNGPLSTLPIPRKLVNLLNGPK